MSSLMKDTDTSNNLLCFPTYNDGNEETTPSKIVV
jgi:hypothetical protein